MTIEPEKLNKPAHNASGFTPEGLFELINQHINDVIWLFSIEKQAFEYISPSVYKVRGLTVEEAMAEELHEAIYEEDYHFIVNHLGPRIHHYTNGEEALKTITNEIRQPCKDGRLIWIEVTTTLIKNLQGEVSHILGVSREITEKKEQEQILKDSHELFENVFNFTATGIALIHENGTFLNINKGFCKMLGYPPSFILKKKFFDFLVKDDTPCVMEIFEAAKKEKSFEKQSEIRLVNVHQQIIWGLLNITGIQSYKDHNTHWIIQILETTARKKAEEIIRLLNADLQNKNQEMEQLVYATSHDLRSPLVNIKGFSNELMYSFEELSKVTRQASKSIRIKTEFQRIEREISESFEYIQISLQKMDRLLSGLLTYSRIGKKIKEFSAIDMNVLMADVVKTHEYLIKQNNVTVKVASLPECFASEEMINQAFSNLLGNAIKYLDTERSGLIEVTGKVKPPYAVYCIRDNGIGIHAKYHKKVFELFYRLNHHKGEGEGLGLASVKKILEVNAGRIWLESTPGVGTAFYVYIPHHEKAGSE